MRRTFPTMLGLAIALTAFSGTSRAQWGYGMYGGGWGGYGWGGWGAGSTVQGSIAQGLGMFNIGAGIFNEKTAIANSINTDTVMRWNQYVYEAQKEATRQYFGRMDAQLAKNQQAFDERMTRIATNPSPRDIRQGDALNAIYDQLSDPRIQPSSLRSADDSISADLVRQIPFVNASEAITISLAKIKDAAEWPRQLRDPRFAESRKQFEALVDQARKEDQEGSISPDTLAQIRAVANRINDSLLETPIDDEQEGIQARNFAKTLIALTRMLEMPKVEKIVDELRSYDEASLSSLMGFMHTFNLRFGPATTPEQNQAYSELFPKMAQMRDRIYAAAKLGDTAPATATTHAPARDFFSAMQLNHARGQFSQNNNNNNGNEKEPAPTPPTPQP